MQVQFGEISSTGKGYEIPDEQWLPVEGVSVRDVAVARVDIRPKDAESVTLTGRLVARVDTGCSRCGQPVVHEVNEEFYYLATMRDEEIVLHAEKECSDEECDTLFLEEPVVDLSEVFREQLLLALPVQMLCSQDCEGICQHCGKHLVNKRCECSGGESNSPFAVLESLKKK